LKVDIAGENYWERFKNYLLKTNVEIPEASVKTEMDSPLREVVGGLKAGLDLKLTLKTTPSFREKLQQAMANRIGELKNQVDKFVEDGVKAIRKARGDDRAHMVFIFDSLEQIRGSLFNEQEVIRSVERLFTNHLRMLRLPYVHAVYTVPPWLKFALPNPPADPRRSGGDHRPARRARRGPERLKLWLRFDDKLRISPQSGRS
jgi:hypothetical protein